MDEETRSRKRQQNRESQRRHRVRQQQLIEQLEDENASLKLRIKQLEDQLTEATFGDRKEILAEKMVRVKDRIGRITNELSQLEGHLHEDFLGGAVSRRVKPRGTSPAMNTIKIPIPLTFNTLVITNTIIVDYLERSGGEPSPRLDDLVGNKTLLKSLCAFANDFIKQVPHMGTYSFLFGGTQWLCCEILMLKMAHAGVSDDQVLPLFEELLLSKEVKDQISQELSTAKETRAVEELVQLSDRVLVHMFKQRETSLIPKQYWPTPLQKYLLRKGEFPSYNINFIMWPEFRDNLMTMWDQLDPDMLSPLWTNFLENVVIKIDGKIFFLYQTALVLKYTYEAHHNGTPYDFTPTLEELHEHGLFETEKWRLTRRLGTKYSQVVPINLVIDDIDDLDERFVIRPRRI